MQPMDNFFYCEMMTHPALFTHTKPEKIALLGQDNDILIETLKHTKVKQLTYIANESAIVPDTRIEFHAADPQEWLSQCANEAFDIIINTQTNDTFNDFVRALTPDGILVQPCPATFLDSSHLLLFFKQLNSAGFYSIQTLNFAQPSYPNGWRILIMASRRPVFKPLREKEIYSRSFTTQYYNYDVHKAALALPEFANYLFDKDKL